MTDLTVRGRIGRSDGAALCERLRVLLARSDADLVVCDVGALAAADLDTVDALAKLQLGARRLGSTIFLRHASSELCELLDLSGLSDVVPGWPDSRVEARGQAKEREQPRGVEEEGDPGDRSG